VDQTVDGDVQPDTFTERGVTATTRVPVVHHQHTSPAAAKTQPAGPSTTQAAGPSTTQPNGPSTTQPNGHSNGQPAGQDTPPPEAASDQVVVGDIPPEPPGFVSRDGLLAKLDPAQGRVLALYPATGLLGLGTTQLAAAYARARLADGWRLVAWVNAAETGSLRAGLAAVAEATGLTDAGSDRKADVADAGQAVRRLLETDGDRCLLVFDDVADPEALRPFVPADGRAQVLITSTRPPAAELAAAVPVDAFRAWTMRRGRRRWRPRLSICRWRWRWPRR
jgi:hypothetical protein